MLANTFFLSLMLTTHAQWIANPREQVSPRNLMGSAGRELLANGLSRRSTCPTGENACGSGCAAGPCCDGTTGYDPQQNFDKNIAPSAPINFLPRDQFANLLVSYCFNL